MYYARVLATVATSFLAEIVPGRYIRSVPSPLSDALRYHSEGLVVIPVRKHVKGPTLTGWQQEGLTAPQSEARVRELFQSHDGNIGILCGSASRIVVVDIDVKNGKQGAQSIAAWEAKYGKLPPTRTHGTPSEGLHLLYRLPRGRRVKSSHKVMGADIDVQGDGAQVLVPGSVLVGVVGSGGRPQVPGPYDLLSDAPIADCPVVLLEQLEAAAGPRGPSDSTAWTVVAYDDPSYEERVQIQRKGFETAPLFLEGQGQGNVRYVMLFQRLGPGLLLDSETTFQSYAEVYDVRLPDGHRWIPECENELRHTLARAYERPMAKGYEPDQLWQEHATLAALEAPMPLPGSAGPGLGGGSGGDVEGLPPFPVQVLPPVLRNFVLAEAERTQTPPDLAAMLVLGCCAAAVAGKYDVEIERGYVEPLNIFALAVLPPGERKSAVFRSCFAPLVEAERLKVQLSKPAQAVAEAKLELAQNLLKEKKKQYGKLSEHAAEQVWDGPKDKGGAVLSREIEEQAAHVATLEVPAAPRLLCDDVTPEKLAMLMAQQGGRMCVASAEGTIFKVISGRYSKDGRASFEVFLLGHAGDALRVDRQSRDSIFVPYPRLTMAIAVQPSVIEGLAENKDMRGQGLLARFFYSFPKSRVGDRDIVTAPMSMDIERAYHDCITKLAGILTPEERSEDDTRIPLLSVSVEARDLHREFRARLEPRLKGDLLEMRDWANKLAGGVGRIAAVLSIVEHGAEVPVSRASMSAALEIGETYLLAHAAHAFDVISATESQVDADALAEWLKRSGLTKLARRDVARLGPRHLRHDRMRRDVSIHELVDRGILSASADGGWVVMAEYL